MHRGMRCLLATTALAASALLGGMAQAQPQVRLEPSAASQCLRSVAGAAAAPDYPFTALKRAQPGKVTVRLTFTAPDGPPRVKIEATEGPEELIDAVLEHAKHLRVPCFPNKAEPVTLRRSYVFDASLEKVHWSRAEDAVDPRLAEQVSCITHRSGGKQPNYPPAAARADVQGRVLARLVFSSPDAPPTAEVVSSPVAHRLNDAVEQWVRGLRMPCLQGEPVRVSQLYFFHLDASAYGFIPLSLLQVMKLSKGLREARLRFDTRQMGCPFELRMLYKQPFAPNEIGEVGEPNPARRPLLEWLSTVELDLSPQDHNTVFGDTASISVACLNIDIKPKE